MKKIETKKIKSAIMLLIVVLIFSILTISSLLLTTEFYKPITQINPPKEKTGSIFKKAILDINGTKYETDIKENTSVFEFMEKLQKENRINFKYRTYFGMGKLIEEINGQMNGDRYWIYYVNGKKATIGISNYKINPGDIIAWKYEKDIN